MFEKYKKVLKVDYDKWYQENKEYRKKLASDKRSLIFHLMP